MTVTEQRFEAFVAELRALCNKHRVTISPSMYDHLQVRDRDEHDAQEEGGIGFPWIENLLEETPS